MTLNDANVMELTFFVAMIVFGIVSDMTTLSRNRTLRTISRFCLFMFFGSFAALILAALTEIIG